ncbi:hypothetical protein DFH09DRAFT_1366143, partial [Mycena vulgaris]
MRHFDSRHFPTSDSHAQSFSVFNRFPTDIALVILEFCSPFDLAQLGLASRTLRAFVTAHRHLWVAAQEKLARGDCPKLPALPAVKSSGNYSQWAYASWLFGGGPCTWCSKWTESQPINFVFSFRACSSTCTSLLFGETNFYVDKAKKYDDFFWGKWLPRLERKLPNGEAIQVYVLRATKDAESERQQAIRVDSGNSHRDPKEFPRRTGKQLDE